MDYRNFLEDKGLAVGRHMGDGRILGSSDCERVGLFAENFATRQIS
jgi:hypothetical protein